MKVSPLPVEALLIEDVLGSHKVDPVRVFLQDTALGKGRFTVECGGRAWSCWWGAMGEGQTVRSFVQICDVPYIVGCLVHFDDETYCTRVVQAVKDALACSN